MSRGLDDKAKSKRSARHESVFASLRDDGKLHFLMKSNLNV